MEYCISLLVNADNAIDVAHAERCPLPFLSCMIDDCLKEGRSVQEGGAVYNFTGPQGFGIANMADGLFAIRKLVYEEKKVSMEEFKEALAWNYDKGLDAQSAGDMTEMIMKAMQKAGKEADASTAAGLLKTFIGMKPGEQKTQRFKEIHLSDITGRNSHNLTLIHTICKNKFQWSAHIKECSIMPSFCFTCFLWFYTADDIVISCVLQR